MKARTPTRTKVKTKAKTESKKKPPPRAKQKKATGRVTYHHGDLKEAVLAAGLHSIADHGIGALSLREIARDLGVSHAAPYRHFPQKEDLLREIAVRGFRQLRDALAIAWETKKTRETFLQRFRRVGSVYLNFAKTEPVRFRVMAAYGILGRDADPTWGAAVGDAFHIFVVMMSEGLRSGRVRGSVATEEAMRLWSGLHGLATLWVDGRLELLKPSGIDAGEFLDRNLRALARS